MRRIKADTTLVGISEFRTKAEEILGLAEREPVIVERRHKPKAVLLSLRQYEQTERTLDAFEDSILGLLAKTREQGRKRRYLSLEELERRVGLRRR